MVKNSPTKCHNKMPKASVSFIVLNPIKKLLLTCQATYLHCCAYQARISQTGCNYLQSLFTVDILRVYSMHISILLIFPSFQGTRWERPHEISIPSAEHYRMDKPPHQILHLRPAENLTRRWLGKSTSSCHYSGWHSLTPNQIMLR